MTDATAPPMPAPPPAEMPPVRSPFLHGPETVRTVFLVTIFAACGPLLGGVTLFGWRAALLAAECVLACVVIERIYFAVRRTPAMLGRTHGVLTGVLLALTLPPFVGWYVPLVASAFAVLVGKAIFGGVGHFLWQPALVGRFAVAVLFASQLAPADWPVLTRQNLLVGDVENAYRLQRPVPWQDATAPHGYDALAYTPTEVKLARLGHDDRPAYATLAAVPRGIENAPPSLLPTLPAMGDLIAGTCPGGIGETSVVLIVVAGLYLIYRNYIHWQLPVSILAAAAATVTVAPIALAGPGGTTVWQWVPGLSPEGKDIGFVYVCYHLFSGELMLVAFFLAAEMTSRPATPGGQVVFGGLVGCLAMLLRLYYPTPIPCYLAVLAANTLTPLLESLFRPRVMGTGYLDWLLHRPNRPRGDRRGGRGPARA